MRGGRWPRADLRLPRRRLRCRVRGHVRGHLRARRHRAQCARAIAQRRSLAERLRRSDERSRDAQRMLLCSAGIWCVESHHVSGIGASRVARAESREERRRYLEEGG